MEKLNNYIQKIKSLPDLDILVETWLEQNCYLVIQTHSVDDFVRKVNNNLQIAKHMNDTEYVKYLVKKLSIEVDQTNWIYVPNRIKIRVKSVKPKEGFTISETLCTLLNIEHNTIFRYKSEIMKLIHKYIYDNRLQNRYDRNVVTPNEPLLSILIPLSENKHEYTYDNLPQHIDGIEYSAQVI